MQQVSSVRSQHLDDSDRKPLCLAKWVQRGQQRDHSTGTGPGLTVAGLTELDPLTWSIRSGEIFHWREGAALWRRASLLVPTQRAQVMFRCNP